MRFFVCTGQNQQKIQKTVFSTKDKSSSQEFQSSAYLNLNLTLNSTSTAVCLCQNITKPFAQCKMKVCFIFQE